MGSLLHCYSLLACFALSSRACALVSLSLSPPPLCLSLLLLYSPSSPVVVSVRSGLQRVQFPPGRAALLAAPGPLHRGQGNRNNQGVSSSSFTSSPSLSSSSVSSSSSSTPLPVYPSSASPDLINLWLTYTGNHNMGSIALPTTFCSTS